MDTADEIVPSCIDKREEQSLQVPATLETERLLLRDVRQEDAVSLFACYSDPEVTRYLLLQRHESAAQTHEFIRAAQDAHEKHEELTWVIERRDSHEVIGTVSCMPGGASGIAYALSRAHWRLGFAVEASAAVMRWVSTQPSIHGLWAIVKSENNASIRVLEKLGFCSGGVLDERSAPANLDPSLFGCRWYWRSAKIA